MFADKANIFLQFGFYTLEYRVESIGTSLYYTVESIGTSILYSRVYRYLYRYTVKLKSLIMFLNMRLHHF